MKIRKIPILFSLLLVLTGCSLPDKLLETVGIGPRPDTETVSLSEAEEQTEWEPTDTSSVNETEYVSEEVIMEEPVRVEVADVRGMTQEEALQILIDQGFGVETEMVESEEGSPGTVVSQSPIGHDFLEPGGTVKLYVSPEAEKISGISMEEFPMLCQYPELPTGCEITSLTMALNYLGYPADRFELSDYYLKKGPVGTVDFREAFEGDPRDGSSFGCYAPVIVNTANAYLSTLGSDRRAIDLTGSSLWDLFPYLDAGIPVVIWATYDCNPGHYSVTWYVNGQALTWYTPEHCLVLIGYDSENVYLANPAYGAVSTYSIDLFNVRYQELGNQAVIIH